MKPSLLKHRGILPVQFGKIGGMLLPVLLLVLSNFASAQSTSKFNDGYPTVFKVTSGAALNNTGTAIVTEEYLPTGAAQAAPNYSVAVPFTGTNKVAVSGTASSAGAMSRSENGRYLIIPGYNGTVGDANTWTVGALRTLNGTGTVGVGISGTFYSTANDLRGATSDDGTNFWTSGGSTGIRYSNNGTTVSTVSSTSTNTRVVNIFNGQLFYSTASGTSQGVYQVGTGKPVTTGNTSVFLAGGTTAAPYGFSVSPDGLTIYAMNGANTISRYTYSGTYNSSTFAYSGGTWSTASTGFALTAATGVAVDWSNYTFTTSANGAKVYACNGTLLVTASDNGTGAMTSTTLRTLTGNNAFRGLAFSPVRETVSLGASTPATGNITQGFNGAVLFQFSLSADEGNSTIKKLVLNQSGTATIGTGNSISNFKLIYDADGNGVASSGEIASAFTVTGTVSGSNITFSGISQTYINEGSSNNYLVIGDVSGSGTGTFIPSIASNKTINSVNYTTNLSNAGLTPITIGATAPTGNTLTISVATSPTIVTSGTLAAVNTTYGTPSATPTSFTASGTNLTNDISIAAPSGFEISKTVGGASGYATSQTLTQSGGTVTATTIYVRLAGTTVFGTYSGNVALTSTGATAVNVATVSSNVSKKGLTVSSAIANNKPYDRTNAATISGATAVGTVNGDAITISGGGTFASINVANGITVTPALTFSGTNSGSYTLTQPATLSANITPKDLTLSGASASNKVYDGNTDATISGTLTGVVSPDDVTVALSGSFDSPFVDVTIPVTSTSILVGADIANYNLVQPTGLTANITAKPLTISGAAAQNKVFDGNTNAVITGTLVGVIAPDDVTLNGTGTFAQSAVGTNIPVTSTSTITGDISNYTLVQPTGLTANISSAPLTPQTITFNPLVDVVYGSGNFNLTATASSGLAVTYVSSDTNVATVSGNTVTITGVGTTTITASQQGDLTYDSAPTVDQTLNVTPKELTISSAVAANKVYDGTSATTVSGTLSGIINSDDVTLIGTGDFSSTDANTGIPVTSTSTLGGTKAGNYFLIQPTTLAANITPKPLTVSGAVANNKVYNGNSVATISGASLSGIVGLDDVSAVGSGTFVSPNVNNGIGVTATITLTGAQASNYSVVQPTGLSANITAAGLTISGLTGNNKVYNSNKIATLSGTPTLVGVFNSDDVSVSGTPVVNFNNKTVGVAKPITVTGYTLAGTKAGNYTLTQPTGLSADVTAASLTITGAAAQSKPFDGTNAAVITGTLSGVISGDTVTLNGTGTFASSAIGNNIAVTSTATLSGTEGPNYIINPQPTGLTANITAPATVFAVGDLSIIGFNWNSPDNFAFVPWVDVTPGTIVKFTDNGFLAAVSANAANNARGGENFVIWKNTGATIPAGTVITIQDNTTASITNNGTIVSGNLNGLSASGDNIFAYQGAALSGSNPDFTNNNNPTTFSGTILFGLYGQGSSAITSWITSGIASSNSSYLPTELNVANGNIAIGALAQKGQYTGLRNNKTTFAAYKAQVTNPSNWTSSPGAGIVTLDTTAFTLATGPTASVISGNATICQSASTNISVAVTGGLSPFTLVYTDGTSNFTVNNYVSGASISVSPSGNTTYTIVSVTDANSLAGTGNSGSAVVGVNANVTYYRDADADGFGNIAVTTVSCTGAPAGYVANNTDCNDADATKHATFSFYADADGDTYGTGSAVSMCAANATTPPANYSVNSTDCDDTKATVHPGAAEIGYNGIDDDCDGLIDEGFPPKVTTIMAAECGITLTALDSQLYADLVGGAQGYQWRITTTSGPSAGQVQLLNTALRVMKLTQLANYAYATTYKVEVAVYYAGFLQPYTASNCTVTTPTATTQLTACPQQVLTTMSDVIYANVVPFATGYRFVVTDPTNVSNTQTFDRPLREFRMNLVTAFTVQFNKVYNIEVAVKNTDGSYLPFSTSGCTVKTPLFPTTSIQEAQCDAYAVPTNTTLIYADSYPGAIAYVFNLTGNGLPAQGIEVTKSTRAFKLGDFTGLIPGATYNVRVRLIFNLADAAGLYGKTCTVTTPGAAKTVQPEVVRTFDAVAYPNPFADSFNIEIKTSANAKIGIKVYDMTGRLLDDRTVTDMNDVTVGASYPSGVYNVVVSQGDEVKTLRVVKR